MRFGKSTWNKSKISDEIETVTDFVAAGSFADLRNKVKYLNEPNYAQLIRTTDLKNGFDEGIYIDNEAFDFLWRVNLDKEAIILPNIGANIGESYFINPRKLPYKRNVLGPNAILLRSKKNNNYFIYSYFQTNSAKNNIAKMVGASGQPKFNKTDLRKFELYIPSIEEQNKIADFLNLIDVRIDTQNKIISDLKIELEEISKKLFAMKNNEEKYLGDLCKITTGKLDANRMVSDGKYRFYTCAEHYYYIDEYAFDCEALLISGNGANVGYIHYYNGKFNAYQRTYVLSNFVGVDAHYLKSYLDVYLKRRIDSEKNTGNMPYIKLDTLSKMRIKTPTMVEQKKIAVSISNLSTKIETEQKILDLYLKQKNYLLKNLFI